MNLLLIIRTFIFSSLISFFIPFTINAQAVSGEKDPYDVFINPPEAARPGVLWMWMGSNLSRSGMSAANQVVT